MIRVKEIDEAIAECQGVRSPNANTCVKLAAYYVIRDHLAEKPEVNMAAGYSYRAPEEQPETVVNIESGTEFSEVLNGQDAQRAWAIMDELMEAVKVLQPRLYAATIRKIKG